MGSISLFSFIFATVNSALDHPQTLRIEGDTVNIQIIHVEHLTHLVVVSLKNADQKKVDTVVNQASDLIRKGKCVCVCPAANELLYTTRNHIVDALHECSLCIAI